MSSYCHWRISPVALASEKCHSSRLPVTPTATTFTIEDQEEPPILRIRNKGKVKKQILIVPKERVDIVDCLRTAKPQ
jgi:hypothetical protein